MTTSTEADRIPKPATSSPDTALLQGASTHPRSRTPIPCVRSVDLFGAANEIEIEHGDSRYRLRKTLLGKLIMTK